MENQNIFNAEILAAGGIPIVDTGGYFTGTEVETALQELGLALSTATLNENIDDRVAALIQNGTGLTWTYDDVANTLTGNVTVSGASAAEPYITIGNTAGLSAERSLTGTANQITITDNGANSTVVLSTPQNIHTGATPTFVGLTLSGITQNSVLFTGVGGHISQDNTNFFWNDTTNTLVLGGTQIGNNMSASISRTSTEATGDNFGMELLNTVSTSTSGTSFGLRFTTNYDADSGTQANIAGIGGAVTISGNGTITELVSNRSGIVSQGVSSATIATAYQFKAGLVAVGASNFTDVIYFGADVNATIGAGSVTRMTFLSIPAIPIGTTKWGINSALDFQLQDGVKLYFEGTATTKGDTYMVYDNVGTTLDCFVNGNEIWNATSTLASFVQTLSTKGFRGAIISKTASYSIGVTDETITVSAASGDATMTLPPSANCTGQMFIIKRTDNTPANIVGIDGNGAETIDGVATQYLASQYDYLIVQSDGTNWHIIG